MSPNAETDPSSPPNPTVAARQRAALLDAITQVAGERGWERTTLRAVVERAGLSRRTVYELFDDKQACFLAAADQLIDRISDLTYAAYTEAGGGRAGVAAALDGLLGFCAHDPAAARVYLVETAISGPDGAARWQEHMDEMSARARCAFGDLRDQLPGQAGQMAIGGVYTVARSRVLAGRARELPALAPDMTDALCLTLGID